MDCACGHSTSEHTFDHGACEHHGCNCVAFERKRQLRAEIGLRDHRRDALNMLAVAVVTGYDYDPGDSDLDDEQPIAVRMTLGDFRRARNLVLVSKESK